MLNANEEKIAIIVASLIFYGSVRFLQPWSAHVCLLPSYHLNPFINYKETWQTSQARDVSRGFTTSWNTA